MHPRLDIGALLREPPDDLDPHRPVVERAAVVLRDGLGGARGVGHVDLRLARGLPAGAVEQLAPPQRPAGAKQLAQVGHGHGGGEARHKQPHGGLKKGGEIQKKIKYMSKKKKERKQSVSASASRANIM
jgi:hypothetical protein